MNKPNQKKITDTNPLVGALSFFSTQSDAILHPIREEMRRKEALTEEFNGITVDTCYCTDTERWETGILRDAIENKWVIVSQHSSEEEARQEHTKWVAYMKENPDCELRDIDNWNLASLEAMEN